MSEGAAERVEVRPAVNPDGKPGVSHETGGDPPIAHDCDVSHETRIPVRGRIALLPIRAYRRLLSPLLGPRCRYHPSCSAYAEEAVKQFGPLRGILLASWRVLRCNPLSDGGFDPLEERRFFRSAEPARAHTHQSSQTP